MRNKILPRELLLKAIEQARREGKIIVTTNGCFDLLHVGHIRYLQAAREMGDLLIVAVNSDDSVRRLKGPRRPIVPQDERAEMLAALECVDYVTIFSEDTPIQLLEQIRPHVHVKGGNYRIEEIGERHVVEAGGGRVVVGINVTGKSTTSLITRILEANHGDS